MPRMVGCFGHHGAVGVVQKGYAAPDELFLAQGHPGKGSHPMGVISCLLVLVFFGGSGPAPDGQFLATGLRVEVRRCCS